MGGYTRRYFNLRKYQYSIRPGRDGERERVVSGDGLVGEGHNSSAGLFLHSDRGVPVRQSHQEGGEKFPSASSSSSPANLVTFMMMARLMDISSTTGQVFSRTIKDLSL